jgi:hypothetical protein
MDSRTTLAHLTIIVLACMVGCGDMPADTGPSTAATPSVPAAPAPTCAERGPCTERPSGLTCTETRTNNLTAGNYGNAGAYPQQWCSRWRQEYEQRCPCVRWALPDAADGGR